MVKIYLSDGRARLPKQDISVLLWNIHPSKTRITSTESRRVISNIVVAAHFLSMPYRERENHIALLELWTIAIATLLGRAKQWNLREGAISSGLELCVEGLDEASEAVLEEAFGRVDLLEGDPIFDAPFLQARKLVVLGYIAAILNARCIRKSETKGLTEKLLEVLQREAPCTPWGEGSWPFEFNIAVCISRLGEGALASEGLVEAWINFVAPARGGGPRDPYWSIEDELKVTLAPWLKEAEAPKANTSFTVESALAFLVRRMRRRSVKSVWPQVSRFLWISYSPDEEWQHFVWENESGVNLVKVQPLQGSWAALRRESFKHRSKLLGDAEAWFLPFFLCVFPHRATASLIGELDFQTSPESAKEEWERSLTMSLSA